MHCKPLMKMKPQDRAVAQTKSYPSQLGPCPAEFETKKCLKGVGKSQAWNRANQINSKIRHKIHDNPVKKILLRMSCLINLDHSAGVFYPSTSRSWSPDLCCTAEHKLLSKKAKSLTVKCFLQHWLIFLIIHVSQWETDWIKSIRL